VSERPAAPIPTTISFIDCINRGDVDALCHLMTEDHALTIFDELPLSGRDANRKAWRGYIASFPRYLIHPLRIAQSGSRVAILGYTTGSHLRLADEEEARQTLIWLAETSGGAVRRWQLVADTPEQRRRHLLSDPRP
jgi:ketosteroid isomerase-like protein